MMAESVKKDNRTKNTTAKFKCSTVNTDLLDLLYAMTAPSGSFSR